MTEDKQAPRGGRRVAAEWEPQEAVWLQWPSDFERVFQGAFAQIAAIVSRYEKLEIIYDSDADREQAAGAIRQWGADPDDAGIDWLQMPNDSAWMRDNGPVYVIEDGRLVVQNWEFNAWGGAFGDHIPFARDNRIPSLVGAYLGAPVEDVAVVHERGNLEFNGIDTVLLNWSTIGDPARNPGYTREQAEKDLRLSFGVSRVVMVEGYAAGELTRGHIDGFARFIDPGTVVVAQCTAASSCRPGDGDAGTLYDAAAATISAAGFDVIRDPILGQVGYRDRVFNAKYLNWLVGNGFVIVGGFGDAALDAAAKRRVADYFPGRDVYVIEILESWYDGGGVHCHTNDQPALDAE
jgi:agmatine deiminase